MLTRANFYRSKAWEKFRAALILERTNEDGFVICAHCGKPIVKKYDCIGHHKIALNDENCNDAAIALNPENVDLVHFKCHNELENRFNGFSQRVYIVWGSPCAGKSTWVKENAQPDDLILDLDRLWEAVCFSPREKKPGRLKANVFGLRDTLIDQIRIRKGTWRNAYVIGGYPIAIVRDRLADMLRAEVVFIDTPKEVCLARASEAWRPFVEEWWEEYSPPGPA